MVGVGMGGWEGPERGDVAIREIAVVTVLFRQQGGMHKVADVQQTLSEWRVPPMPLRCIAPW